MSKCTVGWINVHRVQLVGLDIMECGMRDFVLCFVHSKLNALKERRISNQVRGQNNKIQQEAASCGASYRREEKEWIAKKLGM